MIEQKQRLDTYVQQSFSLSRSQAKEAILAGFVRVNGYVQKPAYLVVEEDDVALDLEQVSAMNKATNVPVKKDSMSIVFLYEDDHVLVVNKPVGMVVHEGDHAGEDTMIDCLQQRSVRLFDSGQANRPGVVHRLDRMTEGVMVFAKSEQAYMALTDQFRERRIEKQYWAILEGNLDNDELVVDGSGMPGTPGIPAAPGGNAGMNGSGVTSSETNMMVHIHPGNLGDDDLEAGMSDLDNTVHRWLNPVAMLTVTVK